MARTGNSPPDRRHCAVCPQGAIIAADALGAARCAFESGNRSVTVRHSVRQSLAGAGDPPDLRRASACPYGADVGAGALGSTASPITGHVDFVSRSRSIPLLTACGSSLGRSYATNAYSVATPRGRLDVAFRTRPTSSPFPIDAVPCFRPLSREARRTPWAKLRVQRVRFHDAVRRPRLRRLEKANPRSQWGADQAMKRQAPVLALLNFGAHQRVRTAPKLQSVGSRRPRCGSASRARLLHVVEANNQVPSLRLDGP